MSDALADAAPRAERGWRACGAAGRGAGAVRGRHCGASGAGQLSPTTPASTTPMAARFPICWAPGRHRRRPAAADASASRPSLPGAACWCGARAPDAAVGLRYAMWRLVAWPLGTVIVAAGLGIFPRPPAFPPAPAAGSASRHCRAVRPCGAGFAAPGCPGCCRWCFCWRVCRWPSWPRACAVMPILRGIRNLPAAIVWARPA
jgi:hypothetical protein